MKKVGQAPFGQADCEKELEELHSDYSEIYFEETPFNSASIKPQTYLIIGRRGSGKTALAQYFSFQTEIRNPVYIDVNEPKVFQRVLSEVASRASEARQIAIPRLEKVWQYVIWCVIFEHTRTESKVIADACDDVCSTGRVSHLINTMFKRVMTWLRESADEIVDERIEELVNNEQLEAAQREVLKIAAKRPVIIAFDTLEKCNTSDDALMNAMAALVQCASDFNHKYKDRGIHLKVFMLGEAFPYLKEDVLQNPSKSVRHSVYLFWRPRDLLRLISWRFFCYLEANDLLRPESRGDINWSNPREVLQKMWIPYFGEYLRNARGFREHSFSYVLRHTQMRPRQLILLCNAIAARASEAGRFPLFTEKDILSAVKDIEKDLAIEIINSFSETYENVHTIVDALMKMPMIFKGNELDRRAPETASEWRPEGSYSPAKFRRLVAELGIVGRVRRHNDVGYIDADFEYSLQERLALTHRDECVIHPMFYSRFNIELNSKSRVIPFSTEREEQDTGGFFE
jgi:hypothetical protein